MQWNKQDWGKILAGRIESLIAECRVDLAKNETGPTATDTNVATLVDEELAGEHAVRSEMLEASAAALREVVQRAHWRPEIPLRGDGKYTADRVVEAFNALEGALTQFPKQCTSAAISNFQRSFKAAAERVQKALSFYSVLIAECGAQGVPTERAYEVFEVRPTLACDIPAECAVQELLASNLSTLDIAVLLTRMQCLAESELELPLLIPAAREDVEEDLQAIFRGQSSLRLRAIAGDFNPPIERAQAVPPPYTKQYLLFHSTWLSCHHWPLSKLLYEAANSGYLRNFILARFAAGDDNVSERVGEAAARLLEDEHLKWNPNADVVHEIAFRSIDSGQVARIVNNQGGDALADYCVRLKGVDLRVQQLARSQPQVYSEVCKRVHALRGAQAAAKAAAAAQETLDEILGNGAPSSR